MIIAMGVPGAGKTSVLKGLSTDYKLVNYGDLMLEIEKKEFGIKDRDEMRKLPIEKQKLAQKLVAEALAKMHGKVILDTHCSVSTPSGYYPGLPFEFLKLWKVEALVYITADVDAISARRAKDPTRTRDADDIKLHDEMNKGYLAAYSAFTGAPVVILFNNQGKLEETVEKMEKILK
ncbi:adenylate kinase [Candidatus Micrarchaeota archaeon]|nr:adenylate kinase [Candidatus Micrarchaeota archaeon]